MTPGDNNQNNSPAKNGYRVSVAMKKLEKLMRMKAVRLGQEESTKKTDFMRLRKNIGNGFTPVQ
jgi:hypothetical protein